jgi:type I restriction enzyme, R subunit
MQRGNSNFAFLQTREPQLYRLGLLAERYFAEDPNTCQIKLRQLSELAAQLIVSHCVV